MEKLSELYQVISVAKELGVAPLIGIRTKLYSKGSGKWESSGGEFAKFGLTTPELIHAVNVLRQEGLAGIALSRFIFILGPKSPILRLLKMP